MAGIASNLDPRLSSPGLTATEAGAVAGEKGGLSLFETTLSRLMPASEPAEIPLAPAAQEAPAAVLAMVMPAPGPTAPLPATAQAAPLSAPALPPPELAKTAGDAMPATAASVAAQQDARPAPGPTRHDTPLRAASPAPLPVRADAHEHVREQLPPAMSGRVTLLASHLATSLPMVRPEALPANSVEADANEPATLPDTAARVAIPVSPALAVVPPSASPDTMPGLPAIPSLPAMPVAAPITQAMPALASDTALAAAAQAPARAVSPPPVEGPARSLPVGKPAGQPDTPVTDLPAEPAASARQPLEEAVRSSVARVAASTGGTREAPATAATASAAMTLSAAPQAAESPRPATPAQPPVALTHTPLQSPAWAHVASQRLAWMVRGGESSAVLAINPESLGPIQVRIHMDGQNARIDLAAQQPVTATLLESHLPRLTAALESQGVRVDELKVGNQALAGDFSATQNTFSGQQAEAGGQGARQPRWMASAGSVGDSGQSAAETVPAVKPRRSGSSLGQVDDFA